eukprot:Amastigsp_a174357_3920.p2 type:complete len:189 gc:universal Amastigsp_a174357_3920:590-24(-)
MLLRQIDCDLLEHLAVVARKHAEERPVAVHHDKAELVLVLQQLAQRLHVEARVAHVKRGIDWSERLDVDRDLLLLAVLRNHGPAEDHKPVRPDLGVQLELRLARGDRREHRETVHARLDVRRSARLFGEHRVDLGDLVTWPNDQRNHRRPAPTGALKRLYQALNAELPDRRVLLAHHVLHGSHSCCRS